ncbi:hypothetical protein Ae168Ps1_6463c [Pseudonocardia sp. Ae168_Ps1]|nr:hypothetical protein Ae168Ps1_6463c [Pseudonocardia sp. Ae168_Ps1]OLL88961.1 hypothetical protein Ae356Ps1_6381c [Pseudonocardia sp. Ae356_Ps1]
MSPAATLGLLQLRLRRRAHRGPVDRTGRDQAEPVLGLPADLPGHDVVASRVDPPAVVRTHQHRRNVDVVIGVAHRDPPARRRVPRPRDPGPVHQLGGHLGPLPVVEHDVLGAVAQRAVPHDPARYLPVRAGRRLGLCDPRGHRRITQVRRQRVDPEAPVFAPAGLVQVRHRIPGRHHPRVHVLVGPARPGPIR